MDRYWGLNCLGHDASLCVIEDNKIIWHKLSSEYSGIPNDNYLNQEIINDALKFGDPNLICYYEDHWKKKHRQLCSGEWRKAFNLLTPKLHLIEHGVYFPLVSIEHHRSHAAAGYFTSNFKDAVVLVADAIGEWETLTVWLAEDNRLSKVESKEYPYSLGLFYSAFTKLFNLQPMKDESKVMEYSKSGNPYKYYDRVKSYLTKNLHKGITDWKDTQDIFDISASVQLVFEEELISYADRYKHLSDNMVLMGGCAYNKLAVNKISKLFNNTYVIKNPGDSSSSIGAVAGYLNKRLKYEIRC